MKSRRTITFIVVAVLVLLVFISMRKTSLGDLVEPLKNGEEIEYIRIELDNGSPEEVAIMAEIRAEAVITFLIEQMEKVKLKYAGSSRGISYTAEDYLLIVHINSLEHKFTLKKDGTLYSDNKQYASVDDEGTVLFEMLDNAFHVQMEKDVEAYEKDAEKLQERIIYEITADLTHDGIADLIQLIITPDEEGLLPVALLKKYGRLAKIKVYRGLPDENFEEEPCYVSSECADSHPSNGTYCLTEKDGQIYLMFSIMYEMQGAATYQYQVYYLGENNIVTVDEDYVQFRTDDSKSLKSEFELTREDIVPKLKEKMTPWIENGSILVALDIDTPLFISTEEEVCPASEYFDLVWAR